MTNPKLYSYSFASIYPLYVQKVTRKGRTRAELDQVLQWLTGHTAKSLQKVIDAKTDLAGLFATAPRLNPNAKLITGVVCGVRVEDLKDETMRNIRYMDKLVDELAQGRAMERILRSPDAMGAAMAKTSAKAKAPAKAKAAKSTTKAKAKTTAKAKAPAKANAPAKAAKATAKAAKARAQPNAKAKAQPNAKAKKRAKRRAA